MGTGILSNIIANTDPGPTSVNTFGALMGIGINVLTGIVISVSTISIVISGIKFIMSEGDPKSVDAAKKSLTYSIIGLILGLTAVVAKTVLVNIVDANIADMPAF